MGRRPVTYKDWRAIWQSELLGLGHSVFVQSKIESHSCPELLRILSRTRCIQNRLHRLRRIQRRLDIEHEVMDPTFCRAVLETFAKEKPE
ncbi:MAG: hypothetical protein V3S55_09370 [Nitrospiraceae bacterium]